MRARRASAPWVCMRSVRSAACPFVARGSAGALKAVPRRVVVARGSVRRARTPRACAPIRRPQRSAGRGTGRWSWTGVEVFALVVFEPNRNGDWPATGSLLLDDMPFCIAQPTTERHGSRSRSRSRSRSGRSSRRRLAQARRDCERARYAHGAGSCAHGGATDHAQRDLRHGLERVGLLEPRPPSQTAAATPGASPPGARQRTRRSSRRERRCTIPGRFGRREGRQRPRLGDREGRITRRVPSRSMSRPRNGADSATQIA